MLHGHLETLIAILIGIENMSFDPLYVMLIPFRGENIHIDHMIIAIINCKHSSVCRPITQSILQCYGFGVCQW